VIGWLYILRDSVLLNPAKGSTEARFAMQQAIVQAVKGFEKDPKLGEMARSVTDEIETLAIMSEQEDTPSEMGAPMTGTYIVENASIAGSVEVCQISRDKAQFRLQVTNMTGAHNQGTMEGVATIVPQGFVYTTNEFGGECTLEFAFAENGNLTVKTQKGDPAVCGFGNAVVPDGQYTKKDGNNPFLSKAEAAAFQKMAGEWVSTTDPKAVVKIADGYYLDVYDGQTMITSHCTYFAKCPADCQPVAKNAPCLRVIGEQEMCYAIIKADGKVLELSQIGGTGNTNRYVKK
jgi:hypothetical protein